MPAFAPAPEPAICAVAMNTRNPAAAASANIARIGGPADFQTDRRSPRVFELAISISNSSAGNATHSSLASSARPNHGTAHQRLPYAQLSNAAKQNKVASVELRAKT
jgi:hypothetical protein